MSVEPGLLDANVLVYALNSDGPQHAVSQALIEAAPTLRPPCISTPRGSANSIPSSPTLAGLLCPLFPWRRATSDRSYPRVARHPPAVHARQRRGRVDGPIATSSRNRRRCLRSAACGNHASAQHPTNLYLQYERLRSLSRTDRHCSTGARLMSAATNLVNKVWNYCNLLRDDGVSYGDYVEQQWTTSVPVRRTTRSPPSPKITTGPASSNSTACRSKDTTATLSKISAKSRASSASSSAKPRTRSRIPPTCAASSSISSTRNLGAPSALTSRAISTKACSKRTRRIPSPAPASTLRPAS